MACCDEEAKIVVVVTIEFLTFGFALVLGWLLLAGISTSCTGFRFLGITLIVIGVSFLVLILTANITCMCSSSFDKPIATCMYCSIVLLVLAVVASGIFTLAVSSKGGGEPIPGRSYKEYHVESYSKWMRNKVNDTHNWKTHYKKAVIKLHVCEKFGEDYELDTLDEFHKRNYVHFFRSSPSFLI